jgi:DNA-binding LacI/PurR family transcriptional regulator
VGLAVSAEPSSIVRAPSFLDFVTAVNHVTAGRRLELTMQIIEPDAAADTYRDWWAERRFGVMIVPDPITADPRIEVLGRTHAPAVVLGPQDGTNELAFVHLNEREAAGSLAKYLVELGHRTIAVVTAPARMQRTVTRVEALRNVLAERGSSLVHKATEATPEEAAVVTRDLLAGPRRPSAIVYDTDQMAIAGLDVARRSGLHVPWDLSIVSCSDSALCRLATPTITTLPTPMCELGLAVGHAVLAVLDGGVDINTVVRVGGLVVRGSTGPASLPG